MTTARVRVLAQARRLPDARIIAIGCGRAVRFGRAIRWGHEDSRFLFRFLEHQQLFRSVSAARDLPTHRRAGELDAGAFRGALSRHQLRRDGDVAPEGALFMARSRALCGGNWLAVQTPEPVPDEDLDRIANGAGRW